LESEYSIDIDAALHLLHIFIIIIEHDNQVPTSVSAINLRQHSKARNIEVDYEHLHLGLVPVDPIDLCLIRLEVDLEEC
jgi:hypothetical protein